MGEAVHAGRNRFMDIAECPEHALESRESSVIFSIIDDKLYLNFTFYYL